MATELAHTARVLWIGPPQPGLDVGPCSVRLSCDLHARRVGRLAAGARERRAGRCCASTARVVVDNSEPVRGAASTGRAASRSTSTVDLEAGRSYELAVEVWPRSASSPIMGARIGRRAAGRGRRVRAGRRRRRRGRRRGGRGRARTGSGSPRGTTGPTSRCPAASASWSRRCSTSTAAPWSSSTRARPSRCPGRERAGAVLMTWYPGEEGADALADMRGRAVRAVGAPAGHVPRPGGGRAGRLGVEGDRYPGVEGKVVYGEGVLVGYRYYETARLAPLFPFGFGLSYGDIVFDDVEVGRGRRLGHGHAGNNGARRGTEVVQVYVRAPESLVRRPDRELVGFAKVASTPASRETVEVELGAARLPLLGRRHPRLALGPGPLRGARRRLVTRHQGEHDGHLGRRAGVVTEPATAGAATSDARDRGPGRGTGCSSSRGGPRSYGSSPTPTGSPWRRCASAPSWASSTRPSSRSPSPPCSAPSASRWGPSPGSACRTCWSWWPP